jgi:hypothetical protein
MENAARGMNIVYILGVNPALLEILKLIYMGGM